MRGRKKRSSGSPGRLAVAMRFFLAGLAGVQDAAPLSAASAGEGETALDILRHKYPEPPVALPELGLPPSGAVLVRTRGCLECHRLGEQGARTGVDLSRVGRRWNADALERFLLHPWGVKTDGTMPDLPLTRGEGLAIAEYLSRLE